MDHQHSLEYIQGVFGRIGSNLKRPVTVYHIGGNAMCWHGLKSTTKDADIVFLDRDEAYVFMDAARASGFMECELVVLKGGYSEMNPFAVLDEVMETPLHEKFMPGIRLDVFYKKVCGVFSFSSGMAERSVKGFSSNNITNRICSQEDIFLFKSATLRDRDIDDMYYLYQKGLSFASIEKELADQLARLGKPKICVKTVSSRWRLLSERFGVRVPIDANNLKK